MKPTNTYSATLTTIRLLEDEKLMKTYHSFFETLKAGPLWSTYSELISKADECAEKLRREVPDLVDKFRVMCKGRDDDDVE